MRYMALEVVIDFTYSTLLLVSGPMDLSFYLGGKIHSFVQHIITVNDAFFRQLCLAPVQPILFSLFPSILYSEFNISQSETALCLFTYSLPLLKSLPFASPPGQFLFKTQLASYFLQESFSSLPGSP